MGNSNTFGEVIEMDSNTFGKVRKMGVSIRSRQYFVKYD